MLGLCSPNTVTEAIYQGHLAKREVACAISLDGRAGDTQSNSMCLFTYGCITIPSATKNIYCFKKKQFCIVKKNKINKSFMLIKRVKWNFLNTME